MSSSQAGAAASWVEEGWAVGATAGVEVGMEAGWVAWEEKAASAASVALEAGWATEAGVTDGAAAVETGEEAG